MKEGYQVEDRQDTAITRYELTVRKKYRSRGGWMLDTNMGPKLLREYENVCSHFSVENEIKAFLIEKGFSRVDSVVPNQEGKLVTELETGEMYVLYNWFSGDECNLRSEKCLESAGGNLGRMHQALRGFELTEKSEDQGEKADTGEELLQLFQRHNRELKRVNGYMKNKKRKNEFEIYAINCFNDYYEKACEAAELLAHCSYYKEYGADRKDISHGEYNYHNLILTPQGMATTGFEKSGYGVQLLDLTYFMRKTLEKNNWSEHAGDAVLSGYDRENALSKQQIEFIYIMLLYPEKYWKLMNHYYNKKKSWLSAKSLEKLEDVRNMEKNREKFLGAFASKYS